MSDRNKHILVFALLGLVLFVAYMPALGGDFLWDDDLYVEENQALRDSRGLLVMWQHRDATPQWYPMVHSTFWIEYQLFGLNTVPYHITNLLLHWLSSFLVFLVLRNLAIRGALFAAALFAVHPVMTESVAWITERKNVLSLALALGSLLAWMRFWPMTNGPSTRSRSDWGYCALSLFLFVAALLSKTVVCALPAVILLLIWWRSPRLDRALLALVPFFAIGLWLALGTAAQERDTVGAVGAEWQLSVVERFLVAGRALWFYVAKVVWPHPLTFIYHRWAIDGSVLWQYAFPLGWGGLLVTLFLLRGRIGRGPVVALCAFSGILVPALGFVDVYPHRFSFVADHFQYHASIALIALLVAMVAGVAKIRSMPPRTLWSVAVLILTGSATYTWSECHKFQGREVLYNSILDDIPDSWFAHNNLGATLVLSEPPRYDEAVERFKRAKIIKPDLKDADGIDPETFAYAQVGAVIMKDFNSISAQRTQEQMLARMRTAITWLEKAVVGNSDYAEAIGTLGAAYAVSGDAEEGLRHLRRARQLDPQDLGIRDNLVRAHREMARHHAESATQFQTDGNTDESRASVAAALRNIDSGVALLRTDDPDIQGSTTRQLLMQLHTMAADILIGTGRRSEAEPRIRAVQDLGRGR